MLTLMLMMMLMLNKLSKLRTSSDSSKPSKPSKLSYASHERVVFPKTSGYMTEINCVRLLHNSIYATHAVVIAGCTTLSTQEAVQH